MSSSPATTYNFFWKGKPRFRGSLPAYFKHMTYTVVPCPEGFKVGGVVYDSYEAVYERLFSRSAGWSLEETEPVYVFERKGCEVPFPSTFARIFNHPSTEGLRVIERGGRFVALVGTEYRGTYQTRFELFKELVMPKGWRMGDALAEDYFKGEDFADPEASFKVPGDVPPEGVVVKSPVVAFAEASKLTVGVPTPSPVAVVDGRSPGPPANAKAVERLLAIIKERVSDDKVTSDLLEIYLSLASE